MQELLRSTVTQLRISTLWNGSLKLPADFDETGQNDEGEFFPETGIRYSGHYLEWLYSFLDANELTEQWILDLVNYLCRTIQNLYPEGYSFDFRIEGDCQNHGNLMHALNGLKAWKDKVSKDDT